MKKKLKQVRSERPSWLAFFHPNLTLGLIAIGLFLSSVAIISAFGVYDSVVNGNQTEMMQSGFRMLLYAVPAYGIFRMKKWARVFELILSYFLIALAGFLIVMYFVDSSESALLLIGGLILIIHGSIAKYLRSAKCLTAFGLASAVKYK
ncbi:MAG: hypothetical protein AB9895_03985 [Negativicutes bacterium]